MSNLVQMDFRVTKEMRSELTELAKKLNVKRSNLLRAAVRNIIELHEEKEDAKANDESNEDNQTDSEA